MDDGDAGAAMREVSLDAQGTVRWRDTGDELRLFGANYCLMSGQDYRMAGRIGADRKAMIDEDMAQFARMGWTALRLCSWGDWENADREGNLVANEHLDLLDYLVAKARARGIYLLLTPIHTYDPAFPDEMGTPSSNVGFSRYFARDRMGADPASIAAQVRYIRQLLSHVNPYTGVALKDEPAIVFIEMINEPVQHPEHPEQALQYIDTLVDAVRSTGCTKPTFYNVTQDIAIAPIVRRSRVDGVTFGWYPSGLVAGHTLHGNFLPAVDAYPEMLRPELRGRPRIVYEFDQADLLTGTMYPAMARTFRSVGAQFATMFAYDELQTAPFNLSWQTHFLNLVHTPRKAMSAVIAAEAMRRLPAYASYGLYPQNTQFDDFRISYEEDLSELNAPDTFLYAGSTRSDPRDPVALQRLAGVGSSPIVQYEGTGAYFLDKLRDGLWRLEIYPDQVMVADPFAQPRPDRIVSRLLYRNWPMTVRLPDLGADYFRIPVRIPGNPSAGELRASGGRVPVEAGVWLLSRNEHVDRAALPARIARVGLDEFHVNARVAYPDEILNETPAEFASGAPIVVRAVVASNELPDDVSLWLRPAGQRGFGKPVPMQRASGNEYMAQLPSQEFAPGTVEFAISTASGGRVSTFPSSHAGGDPRQPWQWPFGPESPWSFRITGAGEAVRLFNPRKDFPQLQFVRISEKIRSDFFRIGAGDRNDEASLEMGLPEPGAEPLERYAGALYVGDVIAAHESRGGHEQAIEVRLRALAGRHKSLELELIERDGTAWRALVPAGTQWSTVRIPIEALEVSRSIHIPSPYPQLWDYWRESPSGRGAKGDQINVGAIERLQFTIFPNTGEHARDDAQGVAIESVSLVAQ